MKTISFSIPTTKSEVTKSLSDAVTKGKERAGYALMIARYKAAGALLAAGQRVCPIGVRVLTEGEDF